MPIQEPIEITDELLASIDAEYNNLSFIDVDELAMVGRHKIKIMSGGTTHELAVAPDASQYLSKWSGVPDHFVTKIEDDNLFMLNWNYFLNKWNTAGDVRALKAVVKRITKEGDEPVHQVIGWTKRGWRGFMPSQVIRACASGIPNAALEREPILMANMVDFNITSPDLRHQFESGVHSDMHHFSVNSRYDVTGTSVPEVRVLGHRQHCGNITYSPYGITGKQLRVYSTTEVELVNRFAQAFSEGAGFIRTVMIPHIEATVNAKVADVANELNDILNKARVPGAVQALVFESLDVENLGGTMYHLINAVNRAANSERCPEKWRDGLRWLAGTMTTSHDPEKPTVRCPTCHTAVQDVVTVSS